MRHFQMRKNMLSALLLLGFAVGEAFAQSDIKLSLVSGTGRGGNEGAAMVCDGDFETKWCIDIPRMLPYSVILDAGQQTTFAEYGFVTGDDTQDYPDRNPVTWRVSGSNDKENWTTIDDQKNNLSLPAENETECRFKPASAPAAFRYFRFEFFRMAGSTRIQLSEICLYKTAQMPIKATFASGTGRDGKEGSAMVADGLLYTKWCVDAPGMMPYTVTLDAGEQTAISEYRFVTGDDTHSYPERNPVTWRVSGSNDQKTWTTLDEQKYNRRLRDENEQEYRFKPSKTGNYRYYRFEFIRMVNGTRIQLSEIKLFK